MVGLDLLRIEEMTSLVFSQADHGLNRGARGGREEGKVGFKEGVLD